MEATGSTRRRALRIGARAVLVALGGVALVGVLHLPFAAPLLRGIMPGSVCPIVRGTPEQIDRAHDIGAAAVRNAGNAPAPVRPALVFALDRTRKPDLDAWAAQHQVRCTSIAGNATLQRCTNVPASAVGQPDDLGPLEEITCEFRSTGQLVDVQTLRRGLSAAQAARTVATLEGQARGALGTPSSVAGEPTSAHLGRGLLATYVATHLFTDFRATITATNLSPTGVMVREEYLSAR